MAEPRRNATNARDAHGDGARGAPGDRLADGRSDGVRKRRRGTRPHRRLRIDGRCGRPPRRRVGQQREHGLRDADAAAGGGTTAAVVAVRTTAVCGVVRGAVDRGHGRRVMTGRIADHAVMGSRSVRPAIAAHAMPRMRIDLRRCGGRGLPAGAVYRRHRRPRPVDHQGEAEQGVEDGAGEAHGRILALSAGEGDVRAMLSGPVSRRERRRRCPIVSVPHRWATQRCGVTAEQARCRKPAWTWWFHRRYQRAERGSTGAGASRFASIGRRMSRAIRCATLGT